MASPVKVSIEDHFVECIEQLRGDPTPHRRARLVSALSELGLKVPWSTEFTDRSLKLYRILGIDMESARDNAIEQYFRGSAETRCSAFDDCRALLEEATALLEQRGDKSIEFIVVAIGLETYVYVEQGPLLRHFPERLRPAAVAAKRYCDARCFSSRLVTR